MRQGLGLAAKCQNPKALWFWAREHSPQKEQGCPRPCHGVSIPEPSFQRTPWSPDLPSPPLPAPPERHLPLQGPQPEGLVVTVPCEMQRVNRSPQLFGKEKLRLRFGPYSAGGCRGAGGRSGHWEQSRDAHVEVMGSICVTISPLLHY